MKQHVLTVRFRHSSNHVRLRKVAQLLGTSMNEIAEAAIEHELDSLAADLLEELDETVQLLREWTYSDDRIEQDLDRFAAGEMGRDPLQARHVPDGPVAGSVDVREMFEEA